MLILPELFSHAKANTSGRGIFPASRYLSDVAGCLSGGACPAQVMSLSNVDDWEKALKASSETLTATDPDWVFDEKSFGTEKGFIMTASGIMSTAKMDSDRDILEPKGATVESVCPYLWHHISIQPVGKVLTSGLSTIKSGDKDIDAVLFKVGILDVGNGLGRDTALLIEMGAIRNSHGFEAIDAKPIKGAGWHVTKYRTFEISAVTIPANSDAVFTEYSKEKSRFTSDPVKSWIKGHYDERQKSWKGWVAPEATNENPTLMVTVDIDVEEAEKKIEALAKKYASILENDAITIDDFRELQESECEEVKEHACSCQKNQSENKVQERIKNEKFYLPGLPGSWEFTQDALRKSCREYIRTHMVPGCGCHYGYIESTFDDYVVLCVYKEDRDCYFKVSWGLENGVPALIGDYTEVDFSFTVTMNTAEKSYKGPTVTENKETISAPEITTQDIPRVVDPVLASLGL